MLDPTRFALNAETVGFRQRMGLPVDWAAFNEALQTQSDCVKVRRELEETPTNEIHVMGGQRFGLEGNAKTNERARQHRQMNGYVLRSFLATGGPIILPPKKNDSLLGMPTHFGHVQYTPNAVLGQQYVSKFTEPLNAPLENNTILLGRAGIAMKSNSISNPYAALQFQMNMEHSQKEIQQTEEAHQNKRSRNSQTEFKRQAEILAAPKHLRPQVSAVQQVADIRARVPKIPPPKPPRRTRVPFSSEEQVSEDLAKASMKHRQGETFKEFKERMESQKDLSSGLEGQSSVENYNPYNLPISGDLMKNYENSQKPFGNENIDARITTLSTSTGYTEQEIRFSLLNNQFDEQRAIEEIETLKQQEQLQLRMDPNQTGAISELDEILNSYDNINQTSFLDFSNSIEVESVNLSLNSTPMRVEGVGSDLIFQNGFPASGPNAGYISGIAVYESGGTTGQGTYRFEDASSLTSSSSAVKPLQLFESEKQTSKNRKPPPGQSEFSDAFLQAAARSHMLEEDLLSRQVRAAEKRAGKKNK